MNPINVEERFAQISDPGYREFIESGETAIIASLLAETHQLDDRAVLALENAIDLYLLLLLNHAELTQFIVNQCGLSPEDATILVSAIDLAIPNDIRIARAITEQSLDNIQTNDISATITETEAALAKLSTTHTMASDAKTIREDAVVGEEQVHQSTQPTLRPGNPYKRPNAPTWGDD